MTIFHLLYASVLVTFVLCIQKTQTSTYLVEYAISMSNFLPFQLLIVICTGTTISKWLRVCSAHCSWYFSNHTCFRNNSRGWCCDRYHFIYNRTGGRDTTSHTSWNSSIAEAKFLREGHHVSQVVLTEVVNGCQTLFKQAIEGLGEKPFRHF